MPIFARILEKGCQTTMRVVKRRFLRAKVGIARLSHRNSVCPSVLPSVCPSVSRVDRSKGVQAKITKSLPSAVWKTLVSGTVKLFHKFEGGHPERGR